MKPHDSTQLPINFPIRRLRLATIISCSALAIITTIWECRDNKEIMTSNAITMARASIEKDIIFRRWAAEHGGVYVPATGKTPPNPWLNVPERDIVTPSGKLLTLMNPAYMTRQIFEISQLSPNSPQGHITSLKPIRPENAPDLWETSALKAFETGVEQRGEFQVMGGKTVYRFMYPLVTEKPCLKCHASQEYREGAVRGGISVAIPTAELERTMLKSNENHMAIIAAIWLAGLAGIWIGFRRIAADAVTLTVERDNLISVFEATTMPMLLVDDRFEVVRDNAAFREYCIDSEMLPDKRCGTLLKCINASAPSQGCGTTSSCDSCDLMRALKDALKSGLSTRNEVSVQRDNRDGSNSEAWLLFGVGAVSLYGKKHALLSFWDITERKREEALRRVRAEEFRALVENSPDPIARYDHLCRRVYVNPAFELLAGKSADNLIGRTPKDALVTDPEVGQQVRNAVEQVFDCAVPQEIEQVWKDPGGITRYFQIRFVPEFDTDKKVASVLGINREITSLRKTEAQLLHSQKMESIGTLAGGVAHDFNNILAVIAGYAELLQLSLKGDEKKLRYVREISDSATRGAELTRSLLTFSGKHEPQKQHDDLNQIVARLQKSMSRLLRSDITLTFQLCDDHLSVYVDRFQIEQVMINLMVNARDALASSGRIQISTTLIEISEEVVTGGVTLSPGSYGVVTVSDDGIGMSEETLGRIFEPFFTTKETGKGTGLGLAIVFGIVGNHNGRISAESCLGKGATFRVYLPISAGEMPQKQLPATETANLYGNETLLLVDDDQVVLELTSELLASFGYTILTAADGMEAVEVFQMHQNIIMMLVTDLMMPRMNGREAIEIIRQHKPDLPVILTSGYADNIIGRSAMEALGVVFLPKPVILQKLVAAIRAGLAEVVT